MEFLVEDMNLEGELITYAGDAAGLRVGVMFDSRHEKNNRERMRERDIARAFLEETLELGIESTPFERRPVPLVENIVVIVDGDFDGIAVRILEFRIGVSGFDAVIIHRVCLQGIISRSFVTGSWGFRADCRRALRMLQWRGNQLRNPLRNFLIR